MEVWTQILWLVVPSGSRGIDLVVTDLDGTVWGRRGWMHSRTVAAVGELQQRGVVVLAATARRPSSALSKMTDNGVVFPAVLFDGSLGRDFASGATFHREFFDADTARWVLAGLVDLGIEPCLNIDHGSADMVVGERPSTHPDHLAEVGPGVRRDDLGAVVADESVLSFLVCGRPGEVFAGVAEALGGRCRVTVSRDLTFGGSMLSVRPAGVTKWAGVLAYCAHAGLDSNRVLAVGDGENDLELLAGAAIACCVDGSCEAVEAAATHRVGGPDVGGWADIIELVG